MMLKLLAVWSMVLLPACSALPQQSLNAESRAPASCASADRAMSSQDAQAITVLRDSVEKGPLYKSAAAASGVAMCRADYESGVIALDYRFLNGNSLQVKRDARIEYTEQKARFVSPPAELPALILTRAERAAFGANGCGIDWGTSETQPAEYAPGTVETIFHGDVCNCQARIGRDAAGHVVELILRSTC